MLNYFMASLCGLIFICPNPLESDAAVVRVIECFASSIILPFRCVTA